MHSSITITADFNATFLYNVTLFFSVLFVKRSTIISVTRSKFFDMFCSIREALQFLFLVTPFFVVFPPWKLQLYNAPKSKYLRNKRLSYAQ